MSFQVSAGGSIQQAAVDKTTVDALVHASDSSMQYLSLATFFAGVALSAALTLAAEVKHPIGIYIALTAATSLAAAMLFALVREGRRALELRKALTTSTGSLHFTITPIVSSSQSVFSSPSTGTSGEVKVTGEGPREPDPEIRKIGADRTQE